jgi:hypothetical protein
MPDTPTPTELINALPADLLQKLIKVASETERGKILDSQLAAMSMDTKDRIARNRAAYRDQYADSFGTFNWKAALLGAPGHEHAYKLLGTTFYLRPPAAKITRAVQAMASSEAGKALQPITVDEFRLLGWLTAVQTDGSAKVELTKHGGPDDQLAVIRQLPDVLLSRVSIEAETLETWLNVQLELDGGKS